MIISFKSRSLLLLALSLAWAVLYTLLLYNKTAPIYLHADVLMNTIMSQEKVSLFYWGQNRLLNVLPFLVTSIHDVRLNVFLVSYLPGLFLTLFFYFATRISVYILGNYLNQLEQEIQIFFQFILLTIIISTFLQSNVIFDLYFAHVEYTLSMLFGAISICIFTTRQTFFKFTIGKIIIAAPFIFVSLGLCPLLVIIYGALVVVYALYLYKKNHSAKSFFFLVSGLLYIGLFFIFWNIVSKHYGQSYIRFSINNLTWDIATNILNSTKVGVFLLECFGLCVMIYLADFIKLFKAPTTLSRAIIVSLLILIGWYILVGSLDWTRLNVYHQRYFYPPLLLMYLTIGIFIFAVSLLVSLKKRILVSCLLICSFLLGYHNHFLLSNPLRYQVFQQINLLVPAEKGRLYAGNYWSSWPLVVRDMALGYQSYGICYRGDAIKDKVLGFVESKLKNGKLIEVVCTNAKSNECLSQIKSYFPKLLVVEKESSGDVIFYDLRQDKIYQ